MIKALFLALCVAGSAAFAGTPELIVSTAEQRMYYVQDGVRKATFSVSTSKFGIGDMPKSFKTPLGTLEVSRKVGQGAATGTVFKALRPTGEVLRPNTPGRDPIVTRVLCLNGIEFPTRNAAKRGIYIHGTPEESKIGRPASYGCIRMRSRDIVRLFDSVPVGAKVMITPFSYRQIAGASFAGN
jgi:hypothetical protein